MDQLQLPGDVVGGVLLLLDVADIQSMRLVCQCWQHAVDHQLRAVKPLYLPPSASATLNSCETACVSMLRCIPTAAHNSSTGSGGAPAAAAAAADCLPGFQLSWRAPLRNFQSICSMQHTAELDLSAQALPADSITLLAQYLTRLRSLKLDACKLSAASLCSLSAFAAAAATPVAAAAASAAGEDGDSDGGAAAAAAGLRSLSISGVKVVKPAQARGAAAGRKSEGPTSEPSVADFLDTVAANPLAHLGMAGFLHMDPELMAAAGYRSLHAAPPAIPICGMCRHLVPLSSTLISLDIMDNYVDADDWHQICSQLTLLTALHVLWLSHDPELDLDPECFSAISQLQRLQSLGLHMVDGAGLTFEPYTLAPIAPNLTALELYNVTCLPLMLSLTGCSSMHKFKLQSVAGAAGAPELIVQLVASMPLLQELHLCNIQAPQLLRVGLCHLGDYMLSQADCCCPSLTRLVMRDMQINGTGLRIAASGMVPTPLHSAAAAAGTTSSLMQPSAAVAGATLPAAAAAGPRLAAGSSGRRGVSRGAAPGDRPAAGAAAVLGGYGPPGSGGLRRLQHLELSAACVMSAALPHLSCLTGLHSLTLWDMKPAAFTQACRYDCFKFVSALTNMTSLSIPAQKPGAAAAAAADAAGMGAAAAGAGNGGALEAMDEGEDGLQVGNGIGAAAAAMEAEAAANGGDGNVSSDDDDDDDPQQQEDNDDEEFVDSSSSNDSSSSDSEHGGDGGGGNGGGGGSSGSSSDDEWEEVDEGDIIFAEAMAAGQAALQGGQGQPGAAAAAAAAAHHQHHQHHQTPLPPIMEPHLHFLARLKSLVALNLGCLHTYGPCLMHLSHLTRLQSLSLSGHIVLTERSLSLLQHLHLPTLRHLSITACRVELGRLQPQHQQHQQQQAAAGAAVNAGGGGGGGGVSGNSRRSSCELGAATRSAFSMDAFVLQVLCGAFPNCENLQLGYCDTLSIVGLAALLQRLPHLQRLWLSSSPGCSYPKRRQGSLPFNFVPCKASAAAAAAQAGAGAAAASTSRSSSSSSGQTHEEQQQQQVEGYVLPYDPGASSRGYTLLQFVSELAWFVEGGLAFHNNESARGASLAGTDASPAPQAPSSAAAPAAAAVMDMPAGSVRVPCVVAAKGLKYVELPDRSCLVRYLDRMVPADANVTAAAST